MSISRNPKNNRWYVLVDVPAGPDGRRRRRGVGGFKTKREAKAAEAEALRRIRDGMFVEPSRLTVGAYLTEMWLPSMASQVRATTLGGYRHNVRAYIVPRLGDIPLQAAHHSSRRRLLRGTGRLRRPERQAAVPKDGPLCPHNPSPCASGCDGGRPGGPQRGRSGPPAARPPS
jgi:hypothetical protein